MNNSNHTQSVDVKLLKDDEWKRIQQNTFTRWVNQHLRKAPGSPKIENLATDFHDGLLLIQLAEVLAQRSLVRFNRKPTMRTQKLDNISTVLNFFQKEEHIKIVNIDSSHIADHNLKLILGLVWTLILHYSLSQPIASTESAAGDEVVNGTDAQQLYPSPRRSGSSSASDQRSPKKRLLAWIQERVPHLAVTNFTTDWSNGIVLGALVDACLGSDAFAEWRQWKGDSNEALLNTHRAMQAAEDGLGVAKLMTPEELTNPNVDEKSVMTYLSQFPRANPLLLGLIIGLNRHLIQHVPCRFRVQMDRSALRPSVDILDPRGNLLLTNSDGGSAISIVHTLDGGQNGDDTANGCPMFDVTFTPALVGQHTVAVFAQNVAEPLGPRLPIETVSVEVQPAPDVVQHEDTDVQNAFQISDFERTNLNDSNLSDIPVPTSRPFSFDEELIGTVVEECQQLTLEPMGEDDNGLMATVTRVTKTTTSYTVAQPDEETEEQYSNEPSLPSDMDNTLPHDQQQQLYHLTESEADDGMTTSTMAKEQMTVVDAVQMTYRQEELQYEPLVLGPDEASSVVLGPMAVRPPQPGFRPLCRERSNDHIEAAALVAAEGHGLQTFVPGQSATFTVDASKTEFSCPKALFVGVVTSRGPAHKVTVEHVGGGRYEVAYTLHDDMDALVFVKYGKNNVDGSPFCVRPMHSHNHNDAFLAEEADSVNYYYRM